nr:hypothetical protein [Clostridium acetobutylicum]
MGQFSVYDTGKAEHTLWTNPEARAQLMAQMGNWWNQIRSGNAYVMGQTAAVAASVLVAPEDIGATASDAGKAESLLGKVGTFSKSIAISSAENAKSVINLPGRALDDVKKAAGFVNGKLLPASGEAVKSFGKVLKNTGKDLKGLTRQVEAEMPGVGRVSVGSNIEFSEVVNDFKNGVGNIKDNFVKAVKSGNGVESKTEIKLGKADLDVYRAQIGVPERNTVSVGKTDVKGLEGKKFNGASPEVRKEGGLQGLDDIFPNRGITAPYDKSIPGHKQFMEHAEEGSIAEFEDAIEKAGLKPEDVKGTFYIHQSNPRGVCDKCTLGLFKPDIYGRKGIFKQLTDKYPNLKIKVTTQMDYSIEFPRGTLSFEVKNGEVLNAVQVRKNPKNKFQFSHYPEQE